MSWVKFILFSWVRARFLQVEKEENVMKSLIKIRGIGTLFLIILLPVFLSIYGCGGGGGGGGAPAGVLYTGSTSQATIDETNAVDIAEGAYTGGEIGGTIGSVGSVQEIGVDRPRYLQIARAIEEAIRQIDVHAPSGVVESGAIVSVSEDIYGACGGSAKYEVEADDTSGVFSGNMKFISFCSEGVTLSGTADFSGTININTEQLSQFTLTFNNLTATLGSDSLTLDGDITYNFGPPAAVTMDMRQRDNASGKVYWVSDFVMTVSEGTGYIQFEASGRFYNPDYGYVELSTPTPFRINSGQNWPSEGVMILAGANNTKARLTVNSATTFVVEADADGDGTYEWSSGDLNWQ